MGCCSAGSSDSSADSGSFVDDGTGTGTGTGTGFGDGFTSGADVSVCAASRLGVKRESESGACSDSIVEGGEDVEGTRGVEGSRDGFDGSIEIAVSSSHGMAVV